MSHILYLRLFIFELHQKNKIYFVDKWFLGFNFLPETTLKLENVRHNN